MTEAVKQKIEEKMVTLTIDSVELTVPVGTLVVDAAKMIGNDIPVFCYHPKMDPVGMCRMCLVDVGLPIKDRATGELMLEKDGSPQIQFGRALQTGCTVEVQEGMVIVGNTEPVETARKDVVEFLLTSHPLDCPICDKGGECPLQNLTMSYGAGESRFILDEKIKLDKHVPLGELIYLDRERCIQCARCTRFQTEIVEDPVIGFNQRGRSLEIVTFSDPGFDSYWSGNTTDICPVGALTTADFRFGARPWEMQSSASVCNQCAVGCNTTFNTRREAKAGGAKVIKRVMPRQNESVNEIWICDKGRFAGYQYTESPNRLTEPLVRKNGKLMSSSWEDALALVAEKTKSAGSGLLSLAGGRLSNEDYYNLNAFTNHQNGKAHLYSEMAGGDLTAQVGVGEGTNFSDMGKDTAILVVASDLEEEAPIWWLRVKQAAERGATVIVANPRRTKLDSQAALSLHYDYGEESALVTALVSSISPKRPDDSIAVKKFLKIKEIIAAGNLFAEADNAVVLFGSEGTSLAASQELSQAAANLLVATGHIGRVNNGLIGVWDKGNVQGAWDIGLRPSQDLAAD
ncbi:MAG: molybdopterin-dependent oxidoreductase [Chloroflexota bacterium]